VVQAIQRGLGSGANEAFTFGHYESAIVHFHKTLDAALSNVLSGVNPKLKSTVHSLGYGAVRGYFRYHAILTKLSAKPLKSVDPLVRAILSVAFGFFRRAESHPFSIATAPVTSKRYGPKDRKAIRYGKQAPLR